MGFFPLCPNHELPMLLKNGPSGAYWYCPDNCAHTQNFLGVARRVEAVNGRPVVTGAVPARRVSRRDGTSKVEAQAIRELDGEQDDR